MTGNESLNELYDMRDKLEAEIKKLRGADRKMKESYLQDINTAIEKVKKKGTGREVLW